MTTTPTRALDARLHELLTGEKCEMRLCDRRIGCEWNEVQSYFSFRGIKWATDEAERRNRAEPGQWAVLPCATNDGLIYKVIPAYHDAPAAIRAAEQLLPVALREDYAQELLTMLTDRSNRLIDYTNGPPKLNYDALYALITATPQQRATAMLAVLERAKALEVAG